MKFLWYGPMEKKSSTNLSAFLILLIKPASSPMKSYSLKSTFSMSLHVLLHNNIIATDLHVKSTDTHLCVLSSSCHPSHIKKSIPCNLALRIRHICSTDDNFKQRTNELLEFLCQRGHKRDYLKTKINKACNVPSKNTLYYQHKKSNNRTVFVTTYNPSLSNFNNIIKKSYPILTASDRSL